MRLGLIARADTTIRMPFRVEEVMSEENGCVFIQQWVTVEFESVARHCSNCGHDLPHIPHLGGCLTGSCSCEGPGEDVSVTVKYVRPIHAATAGDVLSLPHRPPK